MIGWMSFVAIASFKLLQVQLLHRAVHEKNKDALVPTRLDQGLRVGGGVAVEEAGLAGGSESDARSRVKTWA